MCISIPAKILSIDGSCAEVELQGLRKRVLLMVQAREGDWVLLYGGAALRLLDPEQAKEGLAVLTGNAIEQDSKMSFPLAEE